MIVYGLNLISFLGVAGGLGAFFRTEADSVRVQGLRSKPITEDRNRGPRWCRKTVSRRASKVNPGLAALLFIFSQGGREGGREGSLLLPPQHWAGMEPAEWKA